MTFVTTVAPPCYPEIGEYALIGDSRACALVSRDGSVDWMCLPSFDSPSIFGRLLDWERGGHFQVAPEAPYTARRRYIDETNVLETTFHTASGDVALIDFMPAQTERVKREQLAPLRMLVRIVESRGGRVPMRLSYAPRPDYGIGAVHLHAHTPTDVTASRGRHALHLRSDVPLDVSPFDARARFEMTDGCRVRLALAYSSGEPAVIVSGGYVDRLYDDTVAFWKGWTAPITYEGPYRAEVVRSALTLKLLSFAPSGAIIAAPTTSLPEEIGGSRNWDYRFCWIRDAAFTVKAFLGIGLVAEARAFLAWLMHTTHQTAPRLNPLYTVLGEPDVRERELEHLEGYRCSTPVRVGNDAFRQRQLDVYGELIDAFFSFVQEQEHKISGDEARFIREVADYLCSIWREPDSGIWEPRIAPRHYTESKVMAWDALEYAAQLAESGRIRGDAAHWRSEADAVRALILSRGYNEEVRSFTQTLDGDSVDAALLVLPTVGFIAPDDPRMLSTLRVVQQRLDKGGFLRRYVDFDDGLPGDEGTFVFCNFWLASALAQARLTADARAVFERTLHASNDLGLLSEEFEPSSGTRLGNFPQGLSHLSLITAALAIHHAESGLPAERRRWPAVK
jgi:GH15 family glucan-1,4-alpha-glucosidase